MYEDAAVRRVTVYVQLGGNPEPSAFRFKRTGESSAFSWMDASLSYTVVAQADREHLLAVARAIYQHYEAM
jgi:anti-sigma factor RsiW